MNLGGTRPVPQPEHPGVVNFTPDVQVLDCWAEDLDGLWFHSDLQAPYWRFYWNNAPGGIVTIERKDRPLFSDRFYAIAPDTPFSSKQRAPFRQFFIHFLAGAPFDTVQPGLFELPTFPEGCRTIERIVEMLDSPGGYPVAGLTTLARFLVYYALGHLEHLTREAVCADRRIREVLRIMKLHQAEPLCNEELAAQVHMHPNAFIRLFKESTGETPQAFYRARRIERACILLHYSDLSISQIAARTGFCDRYHFSRVFNKTRGMAPGHFRRSRGAGGGGQLTQLHRSESDTTD